MLTLGKRPPLNSQTQVGWVLGKWDMLNYECMPVNFMHAHHSVYTHLLVFFLKPKTKRLILYYTFISMTVMHSAVYTCFSMIYTAENLVIRILMLLVTVIATVNQLYLNQCVLMGSPISLPAELVVDKYFLNDYSLMYLFPYC